MPDTPIDLSEGIQSVRLKVPTAAVPIPPEGFGQLHSPAPGELALRLPDGSVAAIGGGGGGGGDTITGDGGSVSTDATPGHDPGVVLSPVLGKTIWFNGPVVGPGENDPQAPDAVTLIVREEAPAAPPSGFRALWMNEIGIVFRVSSGGDVFAAGLVDASIRADSGGVQLAAFGATATLTPDGSVQLGGANGGGVQIDGATGRVLIAANTNIVLPFLPTADPHVADALWIAPLTRVLMVSAG